MWANLEKNYKRKKIFKQCLDAYKRKEYALCTSTLIPIWERMIAEKSGHKGRLHSNKNKEYVETLIEKNQLSKLLDDFYKNCVMYQCDSEEEVLPDVPGRHAGTHGWIIHNRKTSLNAILLTDFLLRLQPIEQSEYN